MKEEKVLSELEKEIKSIKQEIEEIERGQYLFAFDFISVDRRISDKKEIEFLAKHKNKYKDSHRLLSWSKIDVGDCLSLSFIKAIYIIRESEIDKKIECLKRNNTGEDTIPRLEGFKQCFYPKK